jgi:hypothetical protein
LIDSIIVTVVSDALEESLAVVSMLTNALSVSPEIDITSESGKSITTAVFVEKDKS